MYAVAASTDHFTGDNPTAASGVTAGDGWGCNSDKVTPWISATGTTEMIPSCVPDFSLGLPNGGAFEKTPASNIPTIMDRLEGGGLTWRIYGQPTPSASDGYIWDTCPTFAECLDTSQFGNNVPRVTVRQRCDSRKARELLIDHPGRDRGEEQRAQRIRGSLTQPTQVRAAGRYRGAPMGSGCVAVPARSCPLRRHPRRRSAPARRRSHHGVRSCRRSWRQAPGRAETASRSPRR